MAEPVAGSGLTPRCAKDAASCWTGLTAIACCRNLARRAEADIGEVRELPASGRAPAGAHSGPAREAREAKGSRVPRNTSLKQISSQSPVSADSEISTRRNNPAHARQLLCGASKAIDSHASKGSAASCLIGDEKGRCMQSTWRVRGEASWPEP